MNPIVFALRHPITVMVAIVAMVGGSVLAVQRMKIDVFPDLNLPVIYVAQPYGGMDPAQMEGLLTNYYEYHFLYIAGIHHVESRNIQGVAVMKLFFQPGTDMAQAMAETINYVNRSRAFMPPGTVAPFVMRFDTGSVPVGYLVLNAKDKSKNRTIGEMQRMALFDVRPIFATLPVFSAAINSWSDTFLASMSVGSTFRTMVRWLPPNGGGAETPGRLANMGRTLNRASFWISPTVLVLLDRTR